MAASISLHVPGSITRFIRLALTSRVSAAQDVSGPIRHQLLQLTVFIGGADWQQWRTQPQLI